VEKTNNLLPTTSPYPYSSSASTSIASSARGSPSPGPRGVPGLDLTRLKEGAHNGSPSPGNMSMSPRRRTPRSSRNKSMPRPASLGSAVCNYSGHTSSITSLCVANGSTIPGMQVQRMVCTASQDYTARTFDALDGSCLNMFQGHTATVSSVCVSAARLFTASHDGTLRQWDIARGTGVGMFESISEHLSGRHLTSVCVVGEWVYFGCRDQSAALQRGNIATGEVEVVPSGHADGVTALCASHSCVYSGGLDGNVREFECLDGQSVRVFAGHSKEVTSLCYWHRQLFSGSRDATIKQWCLNSGRCLRTYVGHLSVVRTVFADEYALISGSADGTVRVWNTTTGQCEQMLQQEDAAITALSVYDNALYTACADGNARKFVIAMKA